MFQHNQFKSLAAARLFVVRGRSNRVIRARAFVPVLCLAVLMSACRKEEGAVPPPPPPALEKDKAVELSKPAPSKETEAADPQVALASRLSAYTLEDSDRHEFSIASLRGKAVLLNVWATWCGPCRAEIPQLNALTETSSREGLEVIGISIDEPGTEASVLAFGRAQKIGYRIAFDSKGKIADVMQTTVVPTTVLLDRQGRVVSYLVGPLDTKTPPFQAALRQALQK